MRINGEACLSRYWPPRVAVDLLITSQLRRNLLSCSYKTGLCGRGDSGLGRDTVVLSETRTDWPLCGRILLSNRHPAVPPPHPAQRHLVCSESPPAEPTALDHSPADPSQKVKTHTEGKAALVQLIMRAVVLQWQPVRSTPSMEWLIHLTSVYSEEWARHFLLLGENNSSIIHQGIDLTAGGRVKVGGKHRGSRRRKWRGAGPAGRHYASLLRLLWRSDMLDP
ncbi:unnamed protein product [Gadus morhua 'NCC']